MEITDFEISSYAMSQMDESVLSGNRSRDHPVIFSLIELCVSIRVTSITPFHFR